MFKTVFATSEEGRSRHFHDLRLVRPARMPEKGGEEIRLESTGNCNSRGVRVRRGELFSRPKAKPQNEQTKEEEESHAAKALAKASLPTQYLKRASPKRDLKKRNNDIRGETTHRFLE